MGFHGFTMSVPLRKYNRHGDLGGGFNVKHFYFHPSFGEDEPNLTHIFQMGGETTNQQKFIQR